MAVKILHIDHYSDGLCKALSQAGFQNHFELDAPKEIVEAMMGNYEGLVLRHRFSIDRSFLDRAPALRFIARVGVGLDHIDVAYAASKGIAVLNVPGVNSNAVGEHTLALVLMLFRQLPQSYLGVLKGRWDREVYRGFEIKGRVFGLIGYGGTGKSFAQKISALGGEVLYYDTQSGLGDDYGKPVSLEVLKRESEVISLHVPLDPTTEGLVDGAFIEGVTKNFYLINTARGEVVNTEALIDGLKRGKVLGAGLDVLEKESDFSLLYGQGVWADLLAHPKVVITSHIAGLTFDSHRVMAEVMAQKIIDWYDRNKNH